MSPQRANPDNFWGFLSWLIIMAVFFPQEWAEQFRQTPAGRAASDLFSKLVDLMTAARDLISRKQDDGQR